MEWDIGKSRIRMYECTCLCKSYSSLAVLETLQWQLLCLPPSLNSNRKVVVRSGWSFVFCIITLAWNQFLIAWIFEADVGDVAAWVEVKWSEVKWSEVRWSKVNERTRKRKGLKCVVLPAEGKGGGGVGRDRLRPMHFELSIDSVCILSLIGLLAPCLAL